MSGSWGGYRWGGGGWGASPRRRAFVPVVVVPETGGATLLESLRAYLLPLASLSPATEIYLNRPGRSWQFPYLLITPVNAESELTNTPEYIEEEEFQFSIMSNDDIQCMDLGKAARKALLPHTNSRLYFDDGYEMSRRPTYHGRLIEQPSRGPTNSNVWMYTFGFKFLVGRTETI